jgi:RNA polymerase sigma-70 factor (ECF subfamily)
LIDGVALNQQQSLDSFLKSIEKRAYKITEFAIQDRDEALDLVQNAMIKLVRNYSGHPEATWILLFYRILQNEIRDWKRKAWVRGLFVFNEDQISLIEDKALQSHPDRLLEQDSLNQKIQSAVRQLPLRQQQAFLLRTFEGLDVKQTATAMSCSEGSVKTHYSRAVNVLREQLSGEDL